MVFKDELKAEEFILDSKRSSNGRPFEMIKPTTKKAL